jgi:hypothetical protein
VARNSFLPYLESCFITAHTLSCHESYHLANSLTLKGIDRNGYRVNQRFGQQDEAEIDAGGEVQVVVKVDLPEKLAEDMPSVAFPLDDGSQQLVQLEAKWKLTQASVTKLEAANAKLETANSKLEQRMAELEEKLKNE